MLHIVIYLSIHLWVFERHKSAWTRIRLSAVTRRPCYILLSFYLCVFERPNSGEPERGWPRAAKSGLTPSSRWGYTRIIISVKTKLLYYVAWSIYLSIYLYVFRGGGGRVSLGLTRGEAAQEYSYRFKSGGYVIYRYVYIYLSIQVCVFRGRWGVNL